MKSHHGPVGPWRRVLITPVILDGRPWTARTIRNACLRRHCHQLGRTFRTSKRRLEPVRAACRRLFIALESRSRVLTDLHPKEWPVVPMAMRVAAYHAHWLRAPEDWRPVTQETARQQWDALLHHLFAKYEVPRCLQSAWKWSGPLEHMERDYYCAAAAGQSVRTVNGFPNGVSHRVLHHALTDGTEPTLAQAIWNAQLRVLGVGEELERQAMGSRAVRDLSNHARWLRLVAKFVPCRDNVKDFGLVADALAMVAASWGTPRWDQLLRLPLHELRRFCLRWWRDLLRANDEPFNEDELLLPGTREVLRSVASRVWSPLFPGGWRVVQHDSGNTGYREWRMVELCSQGALIAEGRAMYHCVASYSNLCRSGSGAIFSLRSRDPQDNAAIEARHLTVQVSVRQRSVLQVRGHWNEMPEPATAALVHDWAEANDLRWRA